MGPHTLERTIFGFVETVIENTWGAYLRFLAIISVNSVERMICMQAVPALTLFLTMTG